MQIFILFVIILLVAAIAYWYFFMRGGNAANSTGSDATTEESFIPKEEKGDAMDKVSSMENPAMQDPMQQDDTLPPTNQ
jgi:hypothetical protein